MGTGRDGTAAACAKDKKPDCAHCCEDEHAGCFYGVGTLYLPRCSSQVCMGSRSRSRQRASRLCMHSTVPPSNCRGVRHAQTQSRRCNCGLTMRHELACQRSTRRKWCRAKWRKIHSTMARSMLTWARFHFQRLLPHRCARFRDRRALLVCEGVHGHGLRPLRSDPHATLGGARCSSARDACAASCPGWTAARSSECRLPA